MSLDKLVDSSQLDTDLTSVANAIRTKGGTSGQLAFPAGFVSAVQAIPTGGSPTGTKQISITQNGTTTENVVNYANAEITVNVSGGGPHEVPSGYTQLKFLQSSGTQWIKTSVVPTLETQMQVTGQRLVTTGYNALAGSFNPTIYVPMNNGVYAQRYYIVFGNSGEKTIETPFPVGSAFPPTFTVNKTNATFDTYGMAQKSANIGATGMGTPVDANTRVALFGRYNGTTNACTRTAGIIFRAKFWEDGVLIGDYVPAKRDADDVLGMYDIVNDVFYTNAGTGDFIGGEYE